MLPTEQAIEGYTCHVFYRILEIQDKEHGYRYREKYHKKGFPKEYAENIPCFRSTAFMYADGFRPIRERGDGNQCIVERGRNKQDCAQYGHDVDHVAYISKTQMITIQGTDGNPDFLYLYILAIMIIHRNVVA